MLRFLADAAADSAYDPPDKATWSGMRDACADVLAGAHKTALPE